MIGSLVRGSHCALALGVIATLAVPARASATWSDATRVPRSAEAMWAAAAVNARGDVAVATTAPAKAVRMAVTGPRTVALAWLTGRCDTSENAGGRPFAATVRNGMAGQPVALGDSAATTLIVSPAPGGADVSFAAWPSAAAGGRLEASRINATGTIGAPVAAEDGWIALAGDPASDQLVGHPDLRGGATTSLAVRPMPAGAIDPAPLAAVGYPSTNGTLGAHDGRALAALSFLPLSSMTPSIVIAVWRP